MKKRSGVLTSACLLALTFGGTGCVFRTRIVEPRTSTAKLESASKQQLLDYINAEAAKIQTLNATVDKEGKGNRIPGDSWLHPGAKAQPAAHDWTLPYRA
jgi:hypothetical protein